MNLNKSLLFVEIVNGFTIFNFSSLTFGLEYKNLTYLPTGFTDLKITDDYNFLIIIDSTLDYFVRLKFEYFAAVNYCCLMGIF